jgi:hypothetical protein
MTFMQPYVAHLAAILDFSPQLTPSATMRIALFFRAHTANTSAIGSPKNVYVKSYSWEQYSSRQNLKITNVALTRNLSIDRVLIVEWQTYAVGFATLLVPVRGTRNLVTAIARCWKFSLLGF